MILKVSFKLYSGGNSSWSSWKVIKRNATLIDIEPQWKGMGAKIKAAIIPLLKEIVNASQNYQKEKEEHISAGKGCTKVDPQAEA